MRKKPFIILQWKFWASFLLIYFIPFMILGGLLYFNAVVQLRHQIEAATLDRLDLARNEFERTMNRLESLSVHISSDPELTPYYARLQAYRSDGTIGALRKFKAYNPLIEDILLYYQGDHNLYTTNGLSSFQTLATYSYVFPSSKAGDFQGMLDQMEGPMIMPINMANTPQGDRPRLLAYMLPLPFNSLLYYGSIVFVLDQKKLTEMFDQTLGEFKGHLMIYDENDHVIAAKSNLEHFISEDIVSKMSTFKENGIHESLIRNERYSFSVVRSDKLGWSIVAAMPKDQFLSRVIDMRSFILVVSVFLLFIGAGISMLLSRKFYRPISRLLDQIKEHFSSPAQDMVNEIQYIQETWMVTHRQNQKLNLQVEHQFRYVRDQFLYQLIRGKHPDLELWKSIRSEAKESPFLQGERFFVALLSLDIPADRPVPSGEMEKVSEWLVEISLPHIRAYGLELVERFTYAIMACVMEPALPPRDIQKELADAIRTRMRERYRIQAFIGLGNLYSDINRMNSSFIEASVASDYRMIAGNEGVIYFEDVGHFEDQNQLWLPAAEHLRFIQSLKQGDEKIAQQMLQAIIEYIRAQEKSYFMLRLVCVDLINSVTKVMRELQIEGHADLIRQAAEFKHLDDLKETVHVMITLVCQHVLQMQEKRHSRLGEEILEFVQTHYCSPDLSLSYIAEHFQLSPSYVSRFLKEHSGVLFTEYIFQLRHEQAKQLLVETDKTVRDIVQEIGYAGESKFIERFKKKEGITPGQYRKLNERREKFT